MQTAGNQLQEKVGKMADEAISVRLDQADKLKGLTKRQGEMDKEITQLMDDMLE